ncbi:MAG: hypothetical protein ACR2QK_21255 [Acidimicrobiales bacterium]
MTTLFRGDGDPGPLGLRALLVVCGGVAAVGLVVGLVALAGNLTGEKPVGVRVDADQFAITAAGATSTDDGFTAERVVGTVTGSSSGYFVTSVGRAVQAAAAVLIAVALGLALNTARKGDPFVRANLFRLRIATVAPLLGFAGAVVVSFGHMMATDHAGFTPQTELTFSWLFVALIFAALGEIWKVGVGLREDAQLTI